MYIYTYVFIININLPQFDKSILLPEVFWLLVVIIMLYLYLSSSIRLIIFKTNFYKKLWLSTTLMFNNTLKIDYYKFSECYSENLYLNNLILKNKLLKFNIKLNNLSDFLKYHNSIKIMKIKL